MRACHHGRTTDGPFRSGLRGILTLNRVQGAFLIIRIEITQGLADHETQFDFIVQADALGAQDGSLAGEEDGGSGLEEEERLLGGGIVELGDVVAMSIRPC